MTKRSITNEGSIITKRSIITLTSITQRENIILERSIINYNVNKYYRTRKCTVNQSINQSSVMTAHIVLYK